MLKAVLAGTTAITVVGASLVFAQQGPPAAPGRDAFQQRQLTADDLAALADARIGGLKAGLKLTPAQEKNWPAVETALRERAKLRAERFAEFRKLREQRAQQGDAAQRRGDTVERLRQRADRMATSAESLKRLAEAIDPLYKSLDDGQKQRFALLFRDGGERRHFWSHDRMGPGPQMGPRPGGPERRGPGPRQRRTENEL